MSTWLKHPTTSTIMAAGLGVFAATVYFWGAGGLFFLLLCIFGVIIVVRLYAFLHDVLFPDWR